MSKPKHLIQSYSPDKDSILTFDTNILINLFHAVDYNGAYDSYSEFYEKAKKLGSTLIISSIQISEFINRCIRLQFDLYKKDQGTPELDFKRDYRSTDDYRDNMNSILDTIKCEIIPNFTFKSDAFDTMQTENIFLYGFSYDFNDAFIFEFSRYYGAVLVTHDGDYANYGSKVEMVTNNRALIRFS